MRVSPGWRSSGSSIGRLASQVGILAITQRGRVRPAPDTAAVAKRRASRLLPDDVGEHSRHIGSAAGPCGRASPLDEHFVDPAQPVATRQLVHL